jgi:hypothetical protein
MVVLPIPTTYYRVFCTPRLWYAGQAHSLQRVDECVRAEACGVDTGNKRGSADTRVKSAIGRLIEDVEVYGLRVANVVLISGDVDYNPEVERLLRMRSPSGDFTNVVLVHGLRTYPALRSHDRTLPHIFSLSFDELRAGARTRRAVAPSLPEVCVGYDGRRCDGAFAGRAGGSSSDAASGLQTRSRSASRGPARGRSLSAGRHLRSERDASGV